jgi:hypothetical protein
VLNKCLQRAKNETAAIRENLMTTFDKREQAFEAGLVHDAEIHFKAIARRDKWFGLWAAGQLGKSGADAEAYASALVRADIVGTGGDEVFTKVRADYAAAKVAQTDAQLRRKLNDLFTQALAAVKEG